MNKGIVLIMLFCSIIGCKKTGNSQNIDKELITTNDDVLIYGIDYHINYKFKILINGEYLIEGNEKSNSSGFIPINEYVLENENPTIEIIVYSDKAKKISKEEIDKNIVLKLVNSNNKNFEGFTTVEQLKLSALKTSIHKETLSFKTLLNIEAKKLKSIKGWSGSVNIEKEDQENLFVEVKNYYDSVFQILNSGNSEEYLKLINKREEELSTSYFNSPLILEEQKEEINKVSEAKGKMKVIDYSKYEMKFYGYGKLVTLEDTDGNSPLVFETEDFERYFGFSLHRPTKGAPLEIIR